MSDTDFSELFLFKESDLTFPQTSGIVPITYNGDTYAPYPIGHDEYQVGSDINKQQLTIQTHISNPVAQRYFSKPVDTVVTLDVFQQDSSGTNIVWKGRLVATKQMGNTEVGLVFESVFTSMRRTGLGPKYSKMCRFVLYGPGCGLNPEDWKVPTQLISMNGMSLTVGDLSGYASARFTGGMVRGPDTVVRFVTAQAGNVLTLSRMWPALQSFYDGSGYGSSYGGCYGGVSLTIYPGCTHNMSPTNGCNSFNNKNRYGGFQWIPSRNPFTNSVS